jgi:hypothetical protein
MNDQDIQTARSRRSAWGAVGLAAALLVRGVPSYATTVLRMDVGRQVDQAELIFRGETIRSETIVSADGRMPYTLVTFHVQEVLKGDTSSAEITLRMLGGETDEGVVVVHGMPTFEPGEQVVLFVERNGEVFCPILGWGQGKLRVVRDPASDAELLVTENGEPLRGIENGRWVKDTVREELRDSAEPPGISVVADLDVAAPTRILSDAGGVPGASSARPAVRAEMVLLALRGLVHERASKATYRAGRRLESVDPHDVPPNVGGSAVSGRTGR